jgi:diguanylate cyclase (GGDEF)-like protein
MVPQKKGPLKGTKTDSNPKRSYLHDQVEVLSRGIRSLYHSSEEIQFSKPLPSLLKSILKGLKSATGISRAAILLYEEPDTVEASRLRGCVSVGLLDRNTPEIRVPLEVDEEDTLLLIHPLAGPEVRGTHCFQRLHGLFRERLGLEDPEMQVLEIRNQLVGLLVYEKPADVLARHEIIVLFARQAAFTIDNARLFSKVEEMALRDTLTGLYNRRYVQQILDYELNRSRRYRQPLSLIFIDIDHFKEVNDTYGHAMGDKFLKQVAGKLSGLFRTTDVISRYAGDEFLAVLPSTHAEGVQVLAQRIRNVLDKYVIMCRGRSLTITVSIGVATYDGEEGVGSSTLIDRADQAMYEAKAAGRNCMRIFVPPRAEDDVPAEVR